MQADNGSTNYNAGFALSSTTAPAADARLFLTDGEHNQGAYQDLHRGGPPTYVVGFDDATEGPDGERLQRIADETGGKYFPQTDSTKLQMVVNEIDAQLSCSTPPVTFTDTFTSPGQARSHRVKLGKGATSVNVVTSWIGRDNSFRVASISNSRRRGARIADDSITTTAGMPGDTFSAMDVAPKAKSGTGGGGNAAEAAEAARAGPRPAVVAAAAPWS